MPPEKDLQHTEFISQTELLNKKVILVRTNN